MGSFFDNPLFNPFAFFTNNEMFQPHENPRPEFYAPPPSVYVPPPPPPSLTEIQQAPAMGANTITPVSPLLASTQKNVLESPATGLNLDEDLLKKAQSGSGGFGV